MQNYTSIVHAKKQFELILIDCLRAMRIHCLLAHLLLLDSVFDCNAKLINRLARLAIYASQD